MSMIASVALMSLILLYWILSTSFLSHEKENIQKQLPQVGPNEFIQSHRSRPSNNKNTTLEFVHITKTGGTAIERAAARAGIAWGICHFEARKDTCLNVRPDLGWPQTWPLRANVPYRGNFTNAEYWHTPPHWFVTNPFQEKDTFAVVRNPYDRCISEFYCRYYGYYSKRDFGGANNNNNTTRAFKMNDNPADRIIKFQQLSQQKQAFEARRAARHRGGTHGRRLLQETTTSKDEATLLNEWLLHRIQTYQGLTGHLLPQHYYVFDSNHEKVITHVLKFESLSDDFRTLIQQYNLPVTLSSLERVNVGYDNALTSNNQEKRLTRHNLEPRTIQAINDYCRDDFRLLGYEMMDPN